MEQIYQQKKNEIEREAYNNLGEGCVMISIKKISIYIVSLLVLAFSCTSLVVAESLTQENGPKQFEEWRKNEDYTKLDEAMRQYLIKDGKSWALEWAQQSVKNNLDPCAFFHLFRNLINKAKKSSVGKGEVLEILAYKILVCMRAVADIKICVLYRQLYGPESVDTIDRYKLILANLQHRFKDRIEKFNVSFRDALLKAQELFKSIDIKKQGSPAWVCTIMNDSFSLLWLWRPQEWMSFISPSEKLMKVFQGNYKNNKLAYGDIIMILRQDSFNKTLKVLLTKKSWEDFYSIKESKIPVPLGKIQSLSAENKELNQKIQALSIAQENEKRKLDQEKKERQVQTEELELKIKNLREKFRQKIEKEKYEVETIYKSKLDELGKEFGKNKALFKKEKRILQKELEDSIESLENSLEAKDMIIEDLRKEIEIVKKKKK